ncbi:MAG: hypothetical protein WDO56_09550 [Gammaproteobacteria bacterium]
MKRITRNRTTFDLLHAVDRFAREKGLPIREPTTVETAFGALRSQFAAGQRNDILFHGHRVQTLFAYVASALGGCRLIKTEDVGELYSSIETLRMPDFRVVTHDGRQMMVEVKNCHIADPNDPYEVKPEYLSGLRSYAATFDAELFIAIYWSRIKQWTLLAANEFDPGSSVSMREALVRNRMYLLGDCMVATLPLLVLRLVNSPSYGHPTDKEGRYLFCAQTVQLYCGTNLITDPTEQRIAWFLMNNGRWSVTETPAEFDGPRLTAVSFVLTPPERANPGEKFEIVGSLSELVSRQFDGATTQEGEITSIAPHAEPSDFGVVIPEGFRGTALRLWQFEIHPREGEVSS